jgi:hypothetical protein
MRIIFLLFMFVYGVATVFSPFANVCLCRHGNDGCAHKQIQNIAESPKSCCSNAAENETKEMPDNCYGTTKNINCTKCVNSIFVSHQLPTTIASSDYSQDYAYGQSENLANLTSPNYFLLVKKPPGRINLSLHIKSTVIRC